MYLFHGILIATIGEAKDIVNEHRRFCNCLLSLGGLCGVADCIGKGGLSHLYVSLSFGEHATLARTRVVKRQPVHPTWQETFRIFCAHEVSGGGLTVKVNDDSRLTKCLGSCHVDATELLTGRQLDGCYDLRSCKNPSKVRGRISLNLKFIPVHEDPLVPWCRGVHPTLPLVPRSFFEHKKSNLLRLYQDAHVPDNFCPPISLRGGRPYRPARCWEDLYTAISGAKHLIYIAGWSVFTSITLVRDGARTTPDAMGVLTLGELLKRKSEEGVRVLMLVWDDTTSVTVLKGALKTNGVMHTHDENTEAFFKGTKVQCVLCPRNPDDGSSRVQKIKTELMFTHHQKTVVTDVAVGDDDTNRRLVAFVGGIDLCDGRYDTPHHSLFRTLGPGGVHANDFHQTNFEDANIGMGGPREPWHDVHARVEGPCAWDILKNFEDRWKRQGRQRGRMTLRGPATSLVKIEEVQDILPMSVDVISENDEEAWDGQVFRSIDAGAVVGFPEDSKMAAGMGLVVGKEHTIDRSIQDAYICAIRRAKHFIYMENQYFVGGAPCWETQQNSGAQQLIPMELTLKIVRKIEAGERFTVYVVIPMWPEGVPESSSVQSILHWQHCTMEMMYKRIAKAIEDNGLVGQAKPTDFLNFFCLGNREVPQPHDYTPSHPPRPSSHYGLAQLHRRFMIYVHAKTMIVDDEYIIVGSANCNQRSMDGARDSEIAIGAFQPHHLMNEEESTRPEGQVHGFRLSLWYEHLGELHEDFKYPERIECVNKVQFLSQSFWNLYTQKTIVDMPGHLLPYPITISSNGDVKPLLGYETFPDTRAKVLGTHTTTLPSLLTV